MITVLRDFNAKHPLRDSFSSPNTAINKLFGVFLDFALSQCVTESTRFLSDCRTRSVIDLYATTRPDLVSHISISDRVSDDCCVTAEIKEPTARQQKAVIPVPDMDRVDWDGIRSKLLNAPLVIANQGTSNVNAAWAVLHQNFL